MERINGVREKEVSQLKKFSYLIALLMFLV